MPNKDNGRKVITPKFRASFVRVFKPDAFSEGDEPQYSIVMLFPKSTDLTKMKQAAKAAKLEKWGSKPPKKFQSPFKDGDAEDREEYEDMWVVRAWSKYKPQVVEKNPRVAITDETDFYSGCWARASVQAFAYDYKGMKKGVSFALLNVQKLEDDEPFSGGRSDPMNDFDDDMSNHEPGDFDDDDLDI